MPLIAERIVPAMAPSTPLSPLFLEKPKSSLTAWVDYFRAIEMPVLATTAEQIDALALDEDTVDMNDLAALINNDPLMLLRLLRHAGAKNLKGRNPADPKSVSSLETLILMGITPFFRSFTNLPCAENWLAERMEAMSGLDRVLDLGHRAARFAHGFATQLDDPNAPLIHEAALLHHFVEMMMWLHAPTLAQQIDTLQATTPGLRTRQACRMVLGIDLLELRLALIKAWHLPDVLAQLTDDDHAKRAQVRCVSLAIRLARHTRKDPSLKALMHLPVEQLNTPGGLYHPALAQDVKDIADLLHLGLEPTLSLLPKLV